MNDHPGFAIVDRPRADDAHLIALLLRAQKERRARFRRKPLPPGPSPFTLFVAETEYLLARKVHTKVHGDQHRCEDLVQETYLKVWKGLLRFDPNRLGRGGVLAWLYRIARNTAVSQGRRKRPLVGLEVAHDTTDVEWVGFPEPASPEPGPAEQAHLNQVDRILQEAVAGLRPERRAILKMHYLDDLSHKEIAALMGLTLGQVNMNLYAARQELREKLETVVHERD